MRLFALLVLGAAFSCQSHIAYGQEPQEEMLQRIAWVDELFDDMNSRGIAGGACVIVRDDEIMHIRGYGVESRETGKPVDPQTTRMYLASVTKAFTATLIFRLVDRGLLDLDEDISSYLGEHPSLRLVPSSEPITLRHLLTHTGGFDDRNIGMAVKTLDQVEPLSDYLSRAMPAQVRPSGEITMYDNHGWALAGLIAERVTQQNYSALLQDEIFEPLGMDDSDVDIRNSEGERADFAAAYVTRYQGEDLVWKKVNESYRMTTPAGSIWSTPEDMSHFLRVHLNHGRVGDETYLSSSSATDIQTNSWVPRSGAEGLTAGFWERSLQGRRVLMIIGAAPEGASIVALVPEIGLGVFMSVSRKDASYLTPILEEILARLSPGEVPVSNDDVLAEWDERAGNLAGEYFLLRFSEGSLETLAKWQAWLRVSVVGPGLIQTIDNAGVKRIYREVEEYVFRQDGKPGFLAFKMDPSGDLHWVTTTDGLGFGDGMGFPNSFQKARWFERVQVKRPVLLLSMLVFTIEILIWPLYKSATWIAGRIWRRKRSSENKGSWGMWFPWLAASCGLAGLLGVAMLLADQDQLVVGMPSWSFVPCWLILLFVLLTPFCGWVTVVSWKRSDWSIIDRLFASVVTLNAAMLIPFLWNWNLIGLHF